MPNTPSAVGEAASGKLTILSFHILLFQASHRPFHLPSQQFVGHKACLRIWLFYAEVDPCGTLTITLAKADTQVALQTLIIWFTPKFI